jgi:hypothetical protein
MNTNHQIKDFVSSLVSSYEELTPTGLRKLALDMEEQGIQSISFHATEHYGNAEFICEERRLETDSERNARVERERIDNQRREDWQRRQYEELKRKFEA